MRKSVAEISGFSLMEITVVLTVLAVLSTMGINMYREQDYSRKEQETAARLDLLEQALTNYRNTYHRLPCPANPTLKPGDAGYGYEGQYPGDCRTAGQVPLAPNGTGEMVAGILPFRTLQIPVDMVLDGWGRYVTYAVDRRMTHIQAAIRYTAKECNIGVIRINDASGNARTTRAIYLLLSHGENGHGAYLTSGQVRNAKSTNANELTNANFNTTTFVMRRHSRASASLFNRFDDIVRYKERWSIANAVDVWMGKKTPEYFTKITTGPTTWGASHFCAIDNKKQPYCWGINADGALGAGSSVWPGTWTPYKVLLPPGLAGMTDISAGAGYTCGIGTDGKAYCWGGNWEGETGSIDQDTPATPLPFPTGVTSWKSIHAGWRGTCAIDQDDKAWCWGQNKGNSAGSSDPEVITELAGGHTWLMFARGYYHSCGVTLSGEAYCWGLNSGYQLGDLTTTNRSTPVKVVVPTDGTGFQTIQTGFGSWHDYANTCALAGSGKVYCWGPSLSNFGNGTWWGPPNGWEGNSYGTPVYPPTCAGASFPAYADCNSVPTYTKLSMRGGAGGCALDSLGQAWCWGNVSAIGNGTSNGELSPTAVSMPLGVRFTDIAGHAPFCALGSDKKTYCWGANNGYYGGMGNGETEVYAPASVHYPPPCP